MFERSIWGYYSELRLSSYVRLTSTTVDDIYNIYNGIYNSLIYFVEKGNFFDSELTTGYDRLLCPKFMF